MPRPMQVGLLSNDSQLTLKKKAATDRCGFLIHSIGGGLVFFFRGTSGGWPECFVQ